MNHDTNSVDSRVGLTDQNGTDKANDPHTDNQPEHQLIVEKINES